MGKRALKGLGRAKRLVKAGLDQVGWWFKRELRSSSESSRVRGMGRGGSERSKQWPEMLVDAAEPLAKRTPQQVIELSFKSPDNS